MQLVHLYLPSAAVTFAIHLPRSFVDSPIAQNSRPADPLGSTAAPAVSLRKNARALQVGRYGRLRNYYAQPGAAPRFTTTARARVARARATIVSAPRAIGKDDPAVNFNGGRGEGRRRLPAQQLFAPLFAERFSPITATLHY